MAINKKNIPLYIALSVPVLMVLLVAAFIYFPGLGKKPQYNFIYMTSSLNYGANEYQYNVQNGHLQQISAPVYNNPPVNVATVTPSFYVYNVSTNTAAPVSFIDAQALNLNPNTQSPDGYNIEQGNNSGSGFPFGSVPYDSGWYIKGHNRAQKLNLVLTSSPSFYNNFQFLGWIIK